MKILEIEISASKDHYGACSANCAGIYGAGDTIAEVKNDVETSISLIKSNLPEDQWPEIIRGDYEIKWKYAE